MDKETAKQLLSLVNNFEVMKLLEVYAESRIQRRHKDMETCSPTDLKGHQDAIAEMKRFSSLRVEVLEKVK